MEEEERAAKEAAAEQKPEAETEAEAPKVELEKPLSPDLEQQEPPKSSVVMDKDGRIWYEGAQVQPREVTEALKTLAEKNRDLAVHVAIDKALKRRDFMPLIEAISESGAKLILTGEKEN